ncbi:MULTISPECIES: hypothetical protein [Citricoccus]|uniref:hypothetical protein n=1 Tax=Citricoccus TaxID=169133 RepID=UPI000255F60B|nr:hypothetical protein [Citricoccus sp. CH26A]
MAERTRTPSRARPLRSEAWRVLRVEGRWTGLVADAAAVLTVVSLLAGLLDGAVAVALFALVLLGHVVIRLAPLRPAVQAATAVALPAAAWAAMADAYQRVSWLDIAAHFAVTGLLAVLVAAGVYRAGWLRPGGAAAGTVLLATALGVLLAVAWEFGEWVGHTHLDPAIQVGYDDTIGDLAAGLAGSLTAGVLYRRLTTEGRTP